MQSDSWRQSGIDIVCDITKIPEDDGSFGAVLCTEVLEHVPSPTDALRELVRVLSPGGTLILTAPFASLSHQSPYYFSTGFSKYWYEHWAAEFGLTVLEIGFNGNAFSWMAQQLHWLPGIAEKYAKDRLSLLESLATLIVLRELERFAVHDQGSHELLCWGVHIRARKLMTGRHQIVDDGATARLSTE